MIWRFQIHPSRLDLRACQLAVMLQVAETGLGQLKAGENICVEVLQRSFANQDTFPTDFNTADLPVVTASGLARSSAQSPQRFCNACAGVLFRPFRPSTWRRSAFPGLSAKSTAGNGCWS